MPTCPKCEKSFSIWTKNLGSDLCEKCNRTAKEQQDRGEADEKATKIVKGKIVSCPICGHDKFNKQDSQVPGGVIMGKMRWAEACTCLSCGHVLWFRDSPYS